MTSEAETTWYTVFTLGSVLFYFIDLLCHYYVVWDLLGQTWCNLVFLFYFILDINILYSCTVFAVLCNTYLSFFRAHYVLFQFRSIFRILFIYFMAWCEEYSTYVFAICSFKGKKKTHDSKCLIIINLNHVLRWHSCCRLILFTHRFPDLFTFGFWKVSILELFVLPNVFELNEPNSDKFRQTYQKHVCVLCARLCLLRVHECTVFDVQVCVCVCVHDFCAILRA